MAFSVVPTIQKVTENCFRVTGGALVANTSGTISFTEGSGEAKFNAPNWDPYNLDGEEVSLQDMVQVQTAIEGPNTPNVTLGIRKTGTTKANFLITLHNNSTTTLTPVFEAYISKP